MAKTKGNLPTDCVTLDTYAEFSDDIQRFAEGKFDFLIVIGPPGVGKTETIRRMLGNQPRLEYGGGTAPTPYKFYLDLFDKRDGVVLLDDVDPAFYKNSTTNGWLKTLCETRGTKELAYATAAKLGNVPDRYTTTARVIILSNDWDTASKHVAALEDRAHSIHFAPQPAEVVNYVAGWFWDQEIFDWVWEHRKWIVRPSARVYVKLAKLKAAGVNWKSRGLKMLIGDEKMRQVIELHNDKTLTSNNARAKKFEEMGFGVRSTYFEALKEYRRYTPIAESATCPKLANPNQKPSDNRTLNKTDLSENPTILTMPKRSKALSENAIKKRVRGQAKAVAKRAKAVSKRIKKRPSKATNKRPSKSPRKAPKKSSPKSRRIVAGRIRPIKAKIESKGEATIEPTILRIGFEPLGD